MTANETATVVDPSALRERAELQVSDNDALEDWELELMNDLSAAGATGVVEVHETTDILGDHTPGTEWRGVHDPRHYAVCSCDWQSKKPHRIEGDAKAEADEHARMAGADE